MHIALAIERTYSLNTQFEVFQKNDGLQMLKVEMGGDDQSTEGTESSHESQKHEFSKTNYEFQLIHEVLQVNPSIPICVLPWSFPGWLGNQPYENEKETAGYVVDWLRIGKEQWGFDTYCVGVWNERNFSESYVRELRRTLNSSGFNKTLIVAGEGFQMDDSYRRLLDNDFINDYDIIGVHYPGGRIPPSVQKSGKTIWASEDYSTDNRGSGLGCMARVMNWNYVDGNITAYVCLCVQMSMKLTWWRCGLSMVDEKKFETENAFHVLKYVTGHVKRGWRILSHGRGSGRFEGGGTYVTYTDGHDFTIFVETMSYESSLCQYSSPLPYSVKTNQNIRFEFTGFSQFQVNRLNVSLNFVAPQSVPLLQNIIELSVPIDSFGVLTTLPVTVPQRVTVPTPAFPLKYFDDFSKYSPDEEPRFWMPQKGSWVVREGRAVQKVTEPPISWCTGRTRTPYAVMAYRGKNSLLKADVTIPENSTAESIILGLRSNCSGCDIEVTNCRGIFVEINFSTGKTKVFSDFVHRTEIAEFQARREIKFGKFYRFAIHLIDSHLFVKFGNQLVMTSVDIPEDVIEKTLNDTLFVIGTGNFGISEWDNISTDYFPEIWY
ncbi:hypothetical protein GCK72_009178 [Caenorhabditis remanei]|uniref:galactosylceramidase n=1 Tax=Caenorhabditis remanei TaxID=31234 RepID=A0A6A5H1V4_CAERE|nr:hypothetical protein GCK72_009178 [Caenorhabditis remanei]KAF1760925.1 hypothetical protein GCK72_009178 [Caenorhabditis remanei]